MFRRNRLVGSHVKGHWYIRQMIFGTGHQQKSVYVVVLDPSSWKDALDSTLVRPYLFIREVLFNAGMSTGKSGRKILFDVRFSPRAQHIWSDTYKCRA